MSDSYMPIGQPKTDGILNQGQISIGFLFKVLTDVLSTTPEEIADAFSIDGWDGKKKEVSSSRVHRVLKDLRVTSTQVPAINRHARELQLDPGWKHKYGRAGSDLLQRIVNPPKSLGKFKKAVRREPPSSVLGELNAEASILVAKKAVAMALEGRSVAERMRILEWATDKFV